MTVDEVRIALAIELGPEYSDDLWAVLVDETNVEDEAWYPKDIPNLAARARRIRRLGRASGPFIRRPRDRSDEAERHHALSALLARSALHDPDVRAIRAQIGGTMPWDQVENWIRRQAELDGPPTYVAEVPIPDGHEVHLSSAGYRVTPPFAVDAPSGIRQDDLQFTIPEAHAVQRRATRRGGVLDQLRRLSHRLAEQYGWEESQTASWVLTGIPPAYASISAVESIPATSRFKVVHRLILTIDPAVPAREVAAFYRQVRGDNPQRLMKERHARLAAFVAESSRLTWATRMSRWNRQHPEWAYRLLANFKRDAFAARRNLLQTAR